ncbi:hypothetical protein TWF694_005818 [Orbilia ellipsospora]|uniref:Peptidase S8/S53 domain-containing protein n=1 Tax=Orbilia ellipsospora TaxID=2528407 RepID=A0AAV9WTE6_9PEZI
MRNPRIPLLLSLTLTFLLHTSYTSLLPPGVRDLGWDDNLNWSNTLPISCILIVDPKKWNDKEALTRIEKAVVEGVLNKEGGDERGLFKGSYKGLGTAFFVAIGEYQHWADLILDQFDGKGDVIAWFDNYHEKELAEKVALLDEEANRKHRAVEPVPSEDGDILKRLKRRLRKRDPFDIYQDKHPHFNTSSALISKLSRRKIVQSEESFSSDIQYLSTPPNATGFTFNRYYEDTQGAGIDIYVLDTGFALAHAQQHEELVEAVTNKQIKGWIPSRGLYPLKNNIDCTSGKVGGYHGTKVIAKIIGKRTGSARKANVWVVTAADSQYNEFWYQYIDVLFGIRDKIVAQTKKDKNYKAILNMSLVNPCHRRDKELQVYVSTVTRRERDYLDYISWIQDLALQELQKLKNLIIVTGTGNGYLGDPITAWPAKMGDQVNNLVVVGSVDLAGEINTHVPADFVKIYALGKSLTTPAFAPYSQGKAIPASGDYEIIDGISYATPVVSGILAGHLSANPHWAPKQAIKKLYNDAYPRVENGPKVAWTGIKPTPNVDDIGPDPEPDRPTACKPRPGDNKRRDIMPRQDDGSDLDDLPYCDEIIEDGGHSDPNTMTYAYPTGDFIATKTEALAIETRVVG